MITAKRYAIRHIDGQFLDKDGLKVASVQEACIYYRKGDCTTSLNYLTSRGRWRGPPLEGDIKDYDVVGVIIRTQSEWDLLEETLTKLDGDFVMIKKADLEELVDRNALLSAMEFAGVDNWDDGGQVNAQLREFFPETYKRMWGEED